MYNKTKVDYRTDMGKYQTEYLSSVSYKDAYKNHEPLSDNLEENYDVEVPTEEPPTRKLHPYERMHLDQQKIETGYEEYASTSSDEDVVDHINPSHYKNHIPGYQWIQTIYHKFGPEAYKSFCLITADKYMSRLGKKDPDLRELNKAMWYMEAYRLFVTEGVKPDGNPRLPDEEK